MANSLMQAFGQYMSEQGVSLRKPETDSREKTASAAAETMRANFLRNAEAAIMAKALENMSADPVVRNLLDNGKTAAAAKLASGRYISSDVAQKLAEMPFEAVQVLRAPAEKTAEDESQRFSTSFPHLFGRK